MEHYWQECLRLPQRIQEWDAYKEMRDAIKHYLDVFPTLHKLNSKVCTGSVFPHGFCLLVFQRIESINSCSSVYGSEGSVFLETSIYFLKFQLRLGPLLEKKKV